MKKIFLRLLIIIFTFTLCVNFIRVVLLNDTSNTISFYTVLEGLSECDADMDILIDGFNDFMLSLQDYVASLGDIATAWTLPSEFFSKLAAFVEGFYHLIESLLQFVVIASRGLYELVTGIVRLLVDIFYLFRLWFGYSVNSAIG